MATELETAAAAGHAAEAVGMPQLDFSTYPNQIFWLVVTLFAIYFVLSRIALPRIGAVLAERQGTISNDIAAAEELKLRAQEAERAYEKALADARAEAQRIVAETKAEIKADLDAATAKADAEIAARSAEAEKQIAEIRAGALESVSEVARATTADVIAAMGFRAESGAVDAAVDGKLKG
ncbi:F0F1 ATP synthase subunit B' [Rhodovulum sp. BSW8]|uniref:ATP synthase subunit b n=1 Tax=Rhodovulum visakhapatnamense TaxID=364297 RepID=A0A4R8G9W8_9RHOB|nr:MULTISPECIES: F0F1 ATP synthase subunit B' [Rhodovulum]OLS43867.1 ATP F0F1 synthase subunit B' [Rhodovulum sulfidophilum]MBL3568563.1 F0F1 ATP synthase subunit B' [Rhodovulum visakhapatnamense]MBL3580074.1 F0F1 ATP synthase subunit B' [Rhodovulum visakhapatnamense]RBO52459.1 F0F1 ATP synthase subunit B' [Rhodovulum sp. BSW8]TDX33186.1 F-type H+-transporting ATPase subunit b [Rhodovulum visakhapatnamense]